MPPNHVSRLGKNSMSSSLFTRPFSVRLVALNPSTPRTTRRIVLNSDLLKSAKVFAGDVLIVINEGKEPPAYAVGIAWPASETDEDCALN